MPSFKKRSYQKEMLDEPQVPFHLIRQNMLELDAINHWLGGHAITLKGVRQFKGMYSRMVPLHILEVGCGGGDNLRVIKEWAANKNIGVRLTGVDIKQECIDFAKSRKGNEDIEFICSDYRALQLNHKPDIIFSSLFCHHFTDKELVYGLNWMKENAQLGFFINDLHRHPVAYYTIRQLTGLFSKNELVKNDAPLSVLRGFKREEWVRLFEKAGLKNYQVCWEWAFRWLVTYKNV